MRNNITARQRQEAVTSRRLYRGAGLAISLLTASCTTVMTPGAPPTVIQSTPFGSTIVSQGGQMSPPGGSLAQPPSNLTPDDASAPVTQGGRNGTYSGVAVPLTTAGGLCIQNQTVDNFIVKGDTVRWGRFRGRIRNGDLQMVNGNTWVFGQFDGPRFNGQITANGRMGTPGCTFMMTLEKTGP